MAKSHKAGFGDIEQGPDQRQSVQNRHRPHPGKPGDSAAVRHAHQHGLGLIVGMVGGDDAIGANLTGVTDKQPIAGGARLFLQSGDGLLALPDQNGVGNSKPLRQSGDVLRFRLRFGPQAMVNCSGENFGAGRVGGAPICGEFQKGRRIGTTGDRQQDFAGAQ